MQKDFKLREGIYFVTKDNLEIDIHNNYDFEQAQLFPSTRKANLIWKRRNESWVQTNQPSAILLTFHNITRFQFSKEFLTSQIRTTHEVGFKEFDNFDLNYLNEELHFVESDDLVFRFENDEVIRVHAEKVLLTTLV